MSYPLDLDEYEEMRLVNELNRRICARERGVCDYCGRTSETSACKFPERHSMLVKLKVAVGLNFDRVGS